MKETNSLKLKPRALRAISPGFGYGRIKEFSLKQNKRGFFEKKAKQPKQWSHLDLLADVNNLGNEQDLSMPFSDVMPSTSKASKVMCSLKTVVSKWFGGERLFQFLAFFIDLIIVSSLCALTTLCLRIFYHNNDFILFKFLSSAGFLSIIACLLLAMFIYWALFKKLVSYTIGNYILLQLRTK